VRNILSEYAPGWTNFRIVQHAVYLGFEIGPRGHLFGWATAATKFEARVHYISSLGLGLQASIIAYNSLAISVLAHIAQLRTPADWLIELESKLLPRVIPARSGWISAHAMGCIQAFLLFKRAPLRLVPYCQSIRARVHARNLPDWDIGRNDVFAAVDQAGLLCHPRGAWHYNSIVQCAIDSHQLFGCFSEQEARKVRDSLLVQRVSYLPLSLSYSQFSASSYLCHRFRVWFNLHEAEQASRSATVTAFALEAMPARVLGSILKLWLNAWPLRNLGLHSTRCLVCDLWISGPSIPHLASCPGVKLLCRHVNLPPFCTLSSFLLLSHSPTRLVRRKAIFLYTLHYALCIMSHSHLLGWEHFEKVFKGVHDLKTRSMHKLVDRQI